MEIIQHSIEILLHIDKFLLEIINEYHNWIYLILFCIVFSESAFFFAPFLPGDSMLFALGAIAALPDSELNLMYCMVLLSVGAILGYFVNYFVGKYIGEHILSKNFKYFNRTHLEKTHGFFEKYGAVTIFIARFIPFVRTFAPFVAGLAGMTYHKFLFFNILGGLIWIVGILFAGFFLGNIHWVKQNFSYVVLGIIVASILPILLKLITSLFNKSRA